MKRSEIPLQRKAELKRTPIKATPAPLKRAPWPAAAVPKQRAHLRANAAPQRQQPKTAARQRRRDTGPTAKVRALVRKRSGGQCEWPGCWQQAIQQHHRLNRKNGGRHGEMGRRINQAAWILDACHTHHDRVTDPVGVARQEVEEAGWLLREHQDARDTPVTTRHGRVWLADDGSISNTPPTEEAAA